ncbi:MAG: hypothetical protein ACRD1E_01320, partial [Terriglobales bacterium]
MAILLRGRVVCGALAIALGAGLAGCRRQPAQNPASKLGTTAPGAAAAAPVLPAPEQTAVPTGSNFAAALAPFKLNADLAQALIRDARPVYNLGHIQSGHLLTLQRNAAGAPAALGYQIDGNHTLWLRAPLAAAIAPAADWTAAIETIPYEVRLEGVSGRVESSLF